MKIALIIERFEPDSGGAERSTLELFEELADRGNDVRILAAKGKADRGDVEIIGEGLSFAEFSLACREYLAGKPAEIVHSTLPVYFADVYQPRAGCYGEAIERNAVSYNNKAVEVFKRFTAGFNRRRAALFSSERRIADASTGPVFAGLSSYVTDSFGRHYGLSESRLVTIANGIKIPGSADDESVENLKQRLEREGNIDIGSRGPIFIFAAHNFRLKGLEPLLRAWRVFMGRNSGGNPLLIVAGGDKKAEKYKGLGRKLNIESSVVFAGSIENMNCALAIADAAVLPTYSDACSRFVLEALGFERPVITTRFNGAADFIADTKTGIILNDPGDVERLAESLEFYGDIENRIAAVKDIQKRNLKDIISIKRHVDELVQLYEKILNSKAKK